MRKRPHILTAYSNIKNPDPDPMAQNDPQRGGGRRGNDGPPDLDELFRNLNNKLSRILGGKGGGDDNGGPSAPRSPRGAMKGGVLALGGVLVALWLASGFYVVDAREEGVVLQLGRFNRITDSGLQWHLPYPFEKVEIVTLTEVRSVEIGYRGNAKNRVLEESLMLTEDQNIIDVQLSVQYDVKDPRTFLFNNVFTDKDGKDVVKMVTESAIREVVGKNKVDFVLNEGRGQIAAETQQVIQAMLDRYGTGIRVAKVNINDVQPPEQVQAAFEDAVKAGQDKEKLRNEGQAYANDVIPKARGLATRLLEESQGYKQRVISNAEGEAARFKSVLGEYQKAPAVTRERIYYDTMQKVMQDTTKVIVDQKGGQNLLYLPLDKLMQMTNPQAPAAAGNRPQAAGTPSAEAEAVPQANEGANGRNFSRDVRRGRNQEGGQ